METSFDIYNIYVLFLYIKRLTTGQTIRRPNTGEGKILPTIPVWPSDSLSLTYKWYEVISRVKAAEAWPWITPPPPFLCLHGLWNITLLLHIKLLYFVRVWFFFLLFFLFFSSAEPCTLNSGYIAFTKNWVVHCTSIFFLVCDIEVCFLNWIRSAMPKQIQNNIEESGLYFLTWT